MKTTFEEQLLSAIKAYEEALATCRFSNGADMDAAKRQQMYTACLATIERAVGSNSIYFQQAQQRKYAGYEFVELATAVGICRSLLSDIQNGYLQSLAQVIRSDVFADYLEMSERLNSQGSKDAAAVIAGSTLEAHLKSLCSKYGVATNVDDTPSADTLNDDLVKAGAYSKIDQKNIAAWLGIRSAAAEGSYGAYDQSQVSLLILAVREFIARHPA